LRGIAGWHIEGPFLSASPGFHGAHDPTLMIDPRPDHIRELRDCVPADPLLLTLSPERPGALESIALAKSLGMTVSLGHTDASGDQLRLAVQAGASGFTHLGNGCPQLLDRHDNILWRVLDTSGLTLSLIPDGHHVSPPLFRLIHRAADPNSLFYVTDAMAAAGCPPGRYRIGALDLEVGADGAVRQPGRTNFAGSSLRPCAGVARAARMRRCSWRVAWDQFSLVPARFAGLPAGLRPGGPADLCLIQVQPEPDG
jgi:N-acetylglucosamine-6-phosphate deacetylase